jgi:hypothetical protein
VPVKGGTDSPDPVYGDWKKIDIYATEYEGGKRNYDKALSNYRTLYEADTFRFWLYFDLYPEVPLSKVRQWAEVYTRTDYGDYQAALDVVYELTRRSQLSALSIKQFKAAIREFGITPNVLLGPVWPKVEAYLLSQKCSAVLPVFLVAEVLQWTNLASRMTMDDSALEQACIDDFGANQERLRLLWSTPSETRTVIMRQMRSVLDHCYNDKAFRPSYGHHGSGAVSEKVPDRLASIKCRHLRKTDQLLDFYVRRYDVDVMSDMLPCSDSRPPLVRESRFLTVPKNFKKRRGIAPQPAVLMWYQQGILDAMYEQIWSNPYVRFHLPIFDRTVNQRKALEGSRKHDRWSTYDLKAASDSITVHLVKGVFRPNLRLCLLACRASRTSKHPNMQTYGTMGDATVFPTETLLIGALVQVALIHAKELDPTVNPAQWWVFGDDIVVPNNQQVHKCMHELFSEMGFVINDDKSFFTGPYKESCGVEAYNGVEVQPWYLFNRCAFAQDRANRFSQLIGVANNTQRYGLKVCRQYAIHCLTEECCYGDITLIPFTTNPLDTSKVLTSEITDRGRFRRNRDTHQVQRYAMSVVTKRSDKHVDAEMEEWYKYYMYLLKPPARDADFRRSFRNHALLRKKVWLDVELLE